MNSKRFRRKALLLLAVVACTFGTAILAGADIGTEQWQQTYNATYKTYYYGAFEAVGFTSGGVMLASGHGSAEAMSIRYNAETGTILDDPPEWIRYSTGTDYFYSQVIDSNGDIYLAGRKNPDSPAVWKYNSSADLQSDWPKVHSGASNGRNYGIAMDSSGFIYSVGMYDSNWHINKHDKSDGTTASGFPLSYDHLSLADFAYDVAIDSEGNFTVVGSVGVATGNNDWHVRKYESDGSLLWQASYDFNGFDAVAYDVIVDSEDNLIVSGYRNNGTDNDWYIVKYAKNGDGSGGATILWEQFWDDGNTRSGVARRLLIDSSDNVYIGGSQNNSVNEARSYLQYRDGQTGAVLKLQELSHPVTVNGAAAIEGAYINDLALNGGQLVIAGTISEGYVNYGRTGFITMLERVSNVTPSVTGNGTISPSTPVENIAYNTSTDFTLTPDVLSHVDSVSGTCPAGSLVDNEDGTWTYSTGAIIADCTVVATFRSAFPWVMFAPAILGMGDSSTEDCNGDRGGSATVDNCGICTGGNTGLTACSEDCNGDWGGTATIDNCGVCTGGNTGLTPCPNDCNGDEGGAATVDNCSTCVGGNTGLVACSEDCNDDWGGTATIDNCGMCTGGNTGVTACSEDCNGDWGGTAIVDNCDTCIGGNTGVIACSQDCNGDWGGTATSDTCGICTGGNTGVAPCSQDCNGDWGGTAYTDFCGTCVAGNTGVPPCTQDCNGDWGGTATRDSCGDCVGGNTGEIPCSAYADNGDGTITANWTGLRWQKADDGVKKTWSSAWSYCESLSLGGSNNWRMPTKDELNGLVVCTNGHPVPLAEGQHCGSDGYSSYFSIPTIDSSFECHDDWYWSSSPYPWPNSVWRVSFNLGGPGQESDKNWPNYIRCVHQ